MLQLGLDLGLEVLLLLQLLVDLVLHLVVGAARLSPLRLTAPTGVERDVAGDQAVQTERARAGGRPDGPAQLGADHRADDHALEGRLGAARDVVLPLPLRLRRRLLFLLGLVGRRRLGAGLRAGIGAGGLRVTGGRRRARVTRHARRLGRRGILRRWRSVGGAAALRLRGTRNRLRSRGARAREARAKQPDEQELRCFSARLAHVSRPLSQLYIGRSDFSPRPRSAPRNARLSRRFARGAASD